MLRACLVGVVLCVGCTAVAEEKPIAKLKGIGRKPSASFKVPDNWVVKWKFEEKCFYFRLLDAKTDKSVSMVANTSGATSDGLSPEGKQFFEKGGEYKILPVTGGPWQFTIEKHKFEDEP